MCRRLRRVCNKCRLVLLPYIRDGRILTASGIIRAAGFYKGEKKMEYRRFGDKIIARIDKGEEILEQIEAIALRENILLAHISALGAVNSFTAGVFNVNEKKFYANEFKGDFEIVSLTGTISSMNGKPYTHIHMSAGDNTGAVYGGHLNRAVVSATCEMVITLIDGRVDRKYNEDAGINLFDF